MIYLNDHLGDSYIVEFKQDADYPHGPISEGEVINRHANLAGWKAGIDAHCRKLEMFKNKLRNG